MQGGCPYETKQPVTPADPATFQKGRCSEASRVTVQALRSMIDCLFPYAERGALGEKCEAH